MLVTSRHSAALRTFILLACLAVLASCRGCACQQKPQALHPPSGAPKAPEGMPAIAVHPQAPQPFGAQDVVNYFTSHRALKGGSSVGPLQVTGLDFVTAREVSGRLPGVSTGLADDRKVGFATIAGTFAFSGPPGSKPGTFSRVYAVFDATTGNLLIVSSVGNGTPQK